MLGVESATVIERSARALTNRCWHEAVKLDAGYFAAAQRNMRAT